MHADEVGTNHPIEYTSEEIHVIQEGTKQVFLNTKMHCIWDNNTLLTDLCGFILYSRIKAVTLRQTQQIIEVWQI